MAAALVRAFGNPGAAAAADHAASDANNGTPFNNNFVNNSWDRLKERDPKSPANPDRPRAYLNFVLFDEDFNLVEGSSGVKQVAATPDELQTLAQDNVIMEKSGFLYIYTSNETQQDVFFDNVTVALAGTPVLEETHYYPFGLTIAGISEKALYNPQNKRGFNGNELQNKEFSNGSGLELYDFNARTYDPQIGRFIQLDPLMELCQENWTPYHYAYNNTRFSDPDGRLPIIPVVFIILGLVAASKPAVAPTGQSFDKQPIQDAYKDYHTDVALTFIPGGKPMKVSTSLFVKKTAKEAAEAAAKAARKEAGKKMAKEVKDEISETANETPTTTPNRSVRERSIPTTESPNIQFGRGDKQIYFAFRHTDGLGLDREAVKTAIRNHVPTVSSQVVPGMPLNQVIEDAGQRIQYTAFKLPDGTINVGRIHGAN